VAVHLAGEEAFAVRVTADLLSTAILDVPVLPPLARRMAAWCERPRDRPFDPRAANALWAGLLRPLAEDVPRVRRLVVSASGPLAGVPFEAALLSLADPEEIPRGLWLAIRYEIALEPTPGAHLAWAPRTTGGTRRRFPVVPDGASDSAGAPIATGELVVGGGAAGRPAALRALRLCRSGAHGALLGPFPDDDADGFLAGYPETRPGGRSDVTVVAGLKRRARHADPGNSPPTWAFPLLYGAP
jgi:hypothetical protein